MNFIQTVVACVVCYIAGGLSWAMLTKWLKGAAIPELEAEIEKGGPELKAAYAKLKALL